MVRNATVKAAKAAKRMAEHAENPKRHTGTRKTENAKSAKAAERMLEKRKRTEANEARRQTNIQKAAERVMIDL